MRTLFDASIISLAQVLLLSFCGLGPAQLLLPARLRPHTLTLAPLVGLALLALLGFYATNAGLTLRQILPLALLLALGSLVLAWLRPRGSRWPGRLPARELVPLLLLMLIAWLINLAPVLNYGALTPIGDNWDVEFYLPLADYLKDYSYPTLALAPASPLRNQVMSNPTVARAMGATYAQGLADLLGGWRAWESWVPMLALLRALTLPALYALLREGLGVRVAGALCGCALAAANSLLLWTTYNSFGMSTAGLALLPLALLCTLLALEQGTPRSVGAAALLLGGLSCTYWPMLLAYGAAALGLGLALLLERRRGGWVKVVGRGALVLAGGALLGLLAHLRAPDAFLGVFASQVASLGGAEFVSPAVIAGSAPFSHNGLPPRGLLEVLLWWAGLAAALALLARGIGRGTTRPGLVLGLALCCLLYLLGLRFVVRYPYGLLRGASYVNTLLLGLVGAGLAPQLGIENVKLKMQNAKFSILNSQFSIPAALLLAASTTLAGYRTYGVYAERPAVFELEAAGLRAVAAELKRPGPFYISPAAATSLCGPALGAWAYALQDRELIGVAQSGFGLLDNPQPGVAPAYSLLRRGEDPREYGLDRAALIWQNEDVGLYAAPDRRLAWLNGRSTSYGEAPLCRRDATTYQRAQLGVGSYLQAQPDRPLTLYAGDQLLSQAPLLGAPPAPRELRLALGSFIAQTVEIELGDERRLVELPAGATIYATGIVSAPLRVTLRGRLAPLTLRWASLDAPDSARSGPRLEMQDDIIMFGMTSAAQTADVTTHVEIQNFR